MLLIDLKNTVNEFVVTLSENATGSTSTYLMQLFNQYTNVTYQFTANLISTSERCDVVSVDISNELDNKVLIAGLHNYTFFEGDNIVERGNLKVIDSRINEDVNVQYISIVPEEISDDFIVYNNQD